MRKAWRRLADRTSIERYLAEHRPACLHLGCGIHPLPGWLNTDLEPNDPAVIQLDATQRFPFADAAFDYIFSEHMVEHLPPDGAGSMLDECLRTLKPGGTVRISTPDLAFLLALFNGRLSAMQHEYIEWATRTFVGPSARPRPATVFNNFVRNWGHQFIYDEPTLRERLQLAGFVDIARSPGDSPKPTTDRPRDPMVASVLFWQFVLQKETYGVNKLQVLLHPRILGTALRMLWEVKSVRVALRVRHLFRHGT